jgi:hypothetical protein
MSSKTDAMTASRAAPVRVRDKASVAARVRARAPTYWRYVREQPSWIVMFLFARTLLGRRIERRLAGAVYRRPLAAPGSVLRGVDKDAALAALIDTGVYRGLRLPDAMVHDIAAFAATTPCFARDEQDAGFLPRDVAQANRRRPRDVIAGYYFEAVEDCPAIRRLSGDPALRSIAAAYLGHAPVLIRIRLWWSFPATRICDADLHAVAQEKFHFDMNGWRTLKFFFYLTPTDEKGGAHRCILGSHRRRALRHQLTLTVGHTEDALAAVYGRESFLTITGDAGSGFAEDPFVFHTGSLCQDRPRLILELEYGPTQVSPSYRYGRLG